MTIQPGPPLARPFFGGRGIGVRPAVINKRLNAPTGFHLIATDRKFHRARAWIVSMVCVVTSWRPGHARERRQQRLSGHFVSILVASVAQDPDAETLGRDQAEIGRGVVEA